MFKKAFTMVELVIALFVVSIVAAVTIGVAKMKMEKIDKYTYYIGYSEMQDFAANIVSQFKYLKVDIGDKKPKESTCSDYELLYNESLNACVVPKTTKDLCTVIKKNYNISDSLCDITGDAMKVRFNSGLLIPHIAMANGTNIYIVSDLEKCSALSDAENKDDRIAYTVYVDVNGTDRGKGTLYQDVFPFYLTMSGKVIPGYTSSEVSGGNSSEHLNVNILYDDYNNGTRMVKAAKTSLDFVTGACETGYIKSKKYCGGKSPLNICKDTAKDCRYIINKPMKFFR